MKLKIIKSNNHILSFIIVCQHKTCFNYIKEIVGLEGQNLLREK